MVGIKTLSLALLASTAAAVEFTVQTFQYAGTGCAGYHQSIPAGATFSDSEPFLTLGFSSLDAALGNGASVVDQRTACNLIVQLSYPKGYKYRVASTRTTGNVDIDTGVTAVTRSYYYFAGLSSDAGSTYSIAGPKHATFNVKNSYASLWSPCGENPSLVFNTQVRLTGSGAGKANIATWGDISLEWAKC
ncbi:hypothetical protein BJ508DRAFT_415357 [Ascobolus immersus RN42]|uniref:Secreted protein n=1 Tax=Ascobolus immersus RN42 TaxID=1160509 RepID=A0A3N4I375_ASCIM|nr:hypothetical protein BJ508DRAFT_415357 [Ascobolus immersus RN42]